MKTPFNPSGYLSRGCNDRVSLRLFGIKLIAAAMLLFAATASVPSFQAQAQKPPLKVTNVSASAGANGTTVSIAADGSLGRAQTWQDSEGYHVVVPNTVAAGSMKTVRGVKVRRVGTSLEIVVQTKPGAGVQVQSSDNKLHLAVNGKLDPRSVDAESASSSSSSDERLPRDGQYSNPGGQDGAPFRLSTSANDLTSRSVPTGAETAQNSSNWNQQMGPQASVPNQTSYQGTEPLAAVVPASEIEIQPEDDGLVASVFSGSSVLVVMALGLFGLLVSRKLRSRQAVADAVDSEAVAKLEEGEGLETSMVHAPRNADAGTGLVKDGHSPRVSASNGSTGLARQTSSRLQVAGPTSLFGAYRIDQEVGKLVFGQPHRLDVLSSRAIDDRRAIETSLIKSVNSPDLDENGRRKAREALEEYGFVARQCAALLLAPDAFERTSAARSLGEIKSPTALPFLLEGLYDSESIVRNQAVESIGELKLPAAIGALLDIARTHPDFPSGLLSRTLSACSVEGLDFFDAVMPEPALLGSGLDNDVVEQITHLEPTSSVEELPETADDDQLSKALALVSSDDVQLRAEGLKTLVQFRVQSSIEAMALVARNDPEPNLRSMAISSLGTINNESVFPAILIGMADETREVRAAAARSLNRLSFDRSEAYVRVIETSDEATISSVAKACIQAGIVSQNLDRLATSDHRQAYETFSLICLLAKAKMNQPVLDAIADHSNGDVRIKAVHLLACAGQAEVYDQLRELAVKDGMREDVKTALLEALYKLEQAQPKEEETEAPAATASESQFEVVSSETEADDVTSEFAANITPACEAGSTAEVEPDNQFEFEPMFEAATLKEIEE
ncbi:MAG: HEAT repeat domain-containing protein [Pyrinomonadaceae bacterium]|nr:HEAT repeat domain-containing protein [Pyrinomonadaceae bacterium]